MDGAKAPSVSSTLCVTSSLREATVMSRLFEEKCLDLVECGRHFRRRVGAHRFAVPVVLVADETVQRYRNEHELRGIRDCIRALLRSLQWNEGFMLLPARQALTPIYVTEDRIALLASSVVATTLKYRASLNESHTGLRSIVLSEFTQGVEWACSAVVRIGLVENQPSVPLIAMKELVDVVPALVAGHELPQDA